MKKKYDHPTLYIEEFRLASHIAQGCVTDKGGTPLFQQGKCAWMDAVGEKVFLNTMVGICEDGYDNYDDYQEMCYNTPTPDKKLFSS